MYRFYFKFIVLNVMLLSLISTGLIAFGKAQPPHPALAGFGVCDGIPCWNGIVPGVTTMEQANQLIAAAGYTSPPEYLGFIRHYDEAWFYTAPENSQLCNLAVWYYNNSYVFEPFIRSNESSLVDKLSFTKCGNLTFGEFMTEMGEPNGLLYMVDGTGTPEGLVLVYEGFWVRPLGWWHVYDTDFEIRLNGGSSMYEMPWVGLVRRSLYCYLIDYASRSLCGFRPIIYSTGQSTAPTLPARSPEEDAPLSTLAP